MYCTWRHTGKQDSVSLEFSATYLYEKRPKIGYGTVSKWWIFFKTVFKTVCRQIGHLLGLGGSSISTALVAFGDLMPYCWVSTNDPILACVMPRPWWWRHITSSVTCPFFGSISECLSWKGRSACLKGSRRRIGLTFFIGPSWSCISIFLGLIWRLEGMQALAGRLLSELLRLLRFQRDVALRRWLVRDSPQPFVLAVSCSWYFLVFLYLS